MMKANKRTVVLSLARLTILAAALAATSVARAVQIDAGKAKASADGKTLWYDCKDLVVEGKGWNDAESFYDRLPARARGKAPASVWALSHHSAGLCVRFSTDAPLILIRWTLLSANLAMSHMPATGVSGVDLYAKDRDGRWRFVGVGRPESVSNTAAFTPPSGQPCLLYLPLYNGVKSLAIGIPRGRTISQPDSSTSSKPRKPIVVYGTSIAQGGCASRPGMAFTAIIGRKLDAPVINLGFSGSGKMEPVMADLLAELDPSVYVLDCLSNMTGEEVSERVEPFVKKLRAFHPVTPILLVENSSFQNVVPTHHGRILRATYAKLAGQGVKNLHFLSSQGMLGEDHEGTVDCWHPNDLGMMRMADALTKAISPLLAPIQFASTTEELKAKFSDAQMKRAAAELKEIQAVNEKGPWKPDWASLDKHPLPEWFADAKFGIAVNWGLYSVPAWDLRRAGAMYPDAYPTWMYDLPSHREHHAKAWGKDFAYDDFFPLFTAENYDPRKLIALVHDVGAVHPPFLQAPRRRGLVGFAVDATELRPDGTEKGPAHAVGSGGAKRNIKVGLYCPLGEYAQAALDADGHILARIWPSANARLVPLSDANRRRISGCIPVKDYFNQYMVPLLKEMIDRFDPDMMWLDGEWSDPVEVTHGRETAAYLYNRSLGRKEVCINDRLGIGTRGRYGDFATSESHTFQSFRKYWEEIRSISPSYAYNYEDDEANSLLREALVHMLVNIVSHNGNLLLIVGPDRTGRIPDLQLDRVQALGRWLAVNGEAIYATRILPPYAEGDVR